LCAILLFVAWERYNANAQAVEAANRMMQSSPLGEMMKGMTGGAPLQRSVPAATTYALNFAALSAVGGAVCLGMAQKKPPDHSP
jgi:hypothetical protein